ncbi:hypothetical protein [Mesorhizobium sp. WSM4904]|uniref:hypothetical protein n=1 Tax=Mesorhizobium sp. WSM4904 TaxID=3038545 RepID=UPI0024188588|nr:hypothetical protein [Mesorhizobium sp. WSM4904]WFP60739.1 hypothetical protein QAZ47_19735 [Mesorhizobium sp. WSM4904]
MATFFGLTATDFLTGILVIITAIYAWLTYSIAHSNRRMVAEVQKQIEVQTRPVISFNIEIQHHTIFVARIWNRGASPAENLRLSIDKDFYRFGEMRGESKNIADMYIFKNTLSTLAPGDGFWIELCTGPEVGKTIDGKVITPDKFTIQASYNYGSRKYIESFVIDLRAYFYTSGAKRLPEQLEKIAKSLDNIAKSSQT